MLSYKLFSFCVDLVEGNESHNFGVEIQVFTLIFQGNQKKLLMKIQVNSESCLLNIVNILLRNFKR